MSGPAGAPDDEDGGVVAATRIELRPTATPLPLSFLVLALTSTVFSAVELGWVPAGQSQEAAFTTVLATAPLQLVASVFGFLARDPVAGTGFAVTGVYELTASPVWRTAAGCVGLGVAVLALYAALALELEGAHRREVLPVGRRGPVRQAAVGEEPAREPGVRSRL